MRSSRNESVIAVFVCRRIQEKNRLL